jgi:hypothetical protein
MIKTDGKPTVAWAVPLDPPEPVKPDVVLENGDQLFFKTAKDYLDYITGQSKASA